MLQTLMLTLVDGVRIVVPDSLDVVTTYVVREQEDWFEDEIKFLRHLLKPGQRVIDIGANYGIYTLVMANLIGPEGRAWAFEPASSTADLLASSITANDFGHVVLERSALSSAQGLARLSLNKNAELNELVRDERFSGDSEVVPLVTLDTSMERYRWADIDFMKIDAEGEEANILRGGVRFLGVESPLIQYEVAVGSHLHFELVQQFAKLGYRSYRLVPGLNTLVPFDPDNNVTGYLLNLYCCKSDRAARLAAQGLLIDDVQAGRDVITAASHRNKYGWRAALAGLPYGQMLAAHWEKTVAAGRSVEIEEALRFHAMSRDESLPIADRFAALESSFSILIGMCKADPAYLRVSSLARVAREYGARSIAVTALAQLCDIIFKRREVDPVEPFLAPGQRFDAIPPNGKFGNWLGAAALEEYERTQHFSSYYSGTSGLSRLEAIRDLGFANDEMVRRLALTQERFGTGGQ